MLLRVQPRRNRGRRLVRSTAPFPFLGEELRTKHSLQQKFIGYEEVTRQATRKITVLARLHHDDAPQTLGPSPGCPTPAMSPVQLIAIIA